jgi:hypothetical protein
MSYTDYLSKDFFGLDQYARPAIPPFSKIWFEDGGYKGFIWRLDRQRFYFNDIATSADSYWNTLSELAFKVVK